MTDQFVHLHVHTEYSMLDGAAKVNALFGEAEKLGMPAVAMTDHGNLHGAYDFYSKARRHGIKPIIGIEAYLTPGTMRGERRRRGGGAAKFAIFLGVAAGLVVAALLLLPQLGRLDPAGPAALADGQAALLTLRSHPRVEVLLRNPPGGQAMSPVVAADFFDGRLCLVQRGEREEAFAARQIIGEAGVLHDDGLAGGKVGGRPIAEPAAACFHLEVDRHTELAA